MIHLWPSLTCRRWTACKEDGEYEGRAITVAWLFWTIEWAFGSWRG